MEHSPRIRHHSARLTASEPADCALIYDIDIVRYDPQWLIDNGIDRAKCIAVLESHPSLGFFYDGQPIGGVLFDGESAHMAVLPAFHGRWAFLLKDMLEWLFAFKDPILTTIESGNPQAIRFMERNNWRRVAEVDGGITYEMTRPQRTSRLGIAAPRT